MHLPRLNDYTARAPFATIAQGKERRAKRRHGKPELDSTTDEGRSRLLKPYALQPHGRL
jgi:hypothetical protein